MNIELQETYKKTINGKDKPEGIFWLQKGNDLHPTKFTHLMAEYYEPGEYEIDFNGSTYRNRFGGLALGQLVLSRV